MPGVGARVALLGGIKAKGIRLNFSLKLQKVKWAGVIPHQPQDV